MLKRIPVASHHPSHTVAEFAKTKQKYQILLNEFLELQKEYVSRKRKLQTAKHKKNILLAEVRFLRRRRKYLSEIRSLELEVEKEAGHTQSSDVQNDMGRTRNDCSINDAAFGNPYPVLVSLNNSRDAEEEHVIEPLRVGKQKNLLTRDKKLGKRKISWQDQVPLKV